ncbi:MAG: Mur ligase family protein [bacterium]|nr:Mur ligase family protein [bacterium]
MKNLVQNLSLFYFKILAFLQLKKGYGEIIGITGSAGKTSCRMAISTLLSSKYKVFSTEGGLNSEWGVPLAILKQQSGYSSPTLWLKAFFGSLLTLLFDWQKYDKYVLELGVDKPNDMRYLLSFIKPKVGVVLNVLPVHTEQFVSLGGDLVERIAEEKGKLVAALPPEGTAVLNYDDPLVHQMSGKCRAKIFSFGLNSQSDLWAENVEVGEFGFRMLVHSQNRTYSFETAQWLNRDYAHTILAALAVGVTEGVALETGVEILSQKLELPPGRMGRFSGIKGSVIIDSSYNASREPTLAALDFLASFTDRRKIAALGDMRELGPLSKDEHGAVATKAVQVADEIVAVGPQTRDYFVPKALALGFPADKIHSFLNSQEAGEFIRDTIIQGKEAILVKGSQNTIFMERVVESLLAKPEEDRLKLCRRGEYWDKLRA